MSYTEPVYDPYNDPIDYFEQYDRYRYQHPEYGNAPLKEDWWWELNEPTSDSQVSNRVKSTFPMEDFYNDVLLNADPMLQGPLADIWEGGDRTLSGAINTFNSPEYQEALRKQIGKTEWNQLREKGVLTDDNLPGEELDEAALDYYREGLMNLLATGSPSAQRNLGFWDYGSERFGGRPYPGGELPGFEGPGFSQGGPEGESGAKNAGSGMPDRRMQQGIEDAIYRQPMLAEAPRNAYHAALQRRLGERGYRRAEGRSDSTRAYFREHARGRAGRTARSAAKSVRRGARGQGNPSNYTKRRRNKKGGGGFFGAAGRVISMPN